MTNILAYDIDGRPLRAGDPVVLVGKAVRPSESKHEGASTVVMGKAINIYCDITIDIKSPNGHYYGVRGIDVRRIDADHTPAETGFTELMKKINSGSLEPLEIE